MGLTHAPQHPSVELEMDFTIVALRSAAQSQSAEVSTTGTATSVSVTVRGPAAVDFSQRCSEHLCDQVYPSVDKQTKSARQLGSIPS